MPLVTSSRSPRTPARAEPVGSLIRPKAITEQLDRMYADETTAWRQIIVDKSPEEVAKLNALADASIVDQVQRQIDAGLDVVTDGEQRRFIFTSSFYDGAGGLVAAKERVTLPNGGSILAEPVLTDHLSKTGSVAAEEATYMRAVTDFPFKVTIPAPSYYFIDFASIEGSAYSHKGDFVKDAVKVTKQIVADAIAAGARWIQFDFPIYPALVSTSTGQLGDLISNVGESREWILEQALEADALVTQDIPDDVTVAMHICRGSVEGGFWNGSLEPIAERLFNELPHTRFLLEWADVARHGDYSAIKHAPSGKIIAMGVVSGLRPEVETEEELLRAIDQAGEHLDTAQLALCSQCGFASAYGDNNVSAEDNQWRKLEVIGKVADSVWGSA